MDHRERLVGCHPLLVERLCRALDEMMVLGHPMFVTEGLRTIARQQALYAQGRTTPGKIVTYKDGIKHRSNHQPKADGLGYAADCAFVGEAYPSDHHLWEIFGEAVERAGLAWGGRWKMDDTPHAELLGTQLA